MKYDIPYNISVTEAKHKLDVKFMTASLIGIQTSPSQVNYGVCLVNILQKNWVTYYSTPVNYPNKGVVSMW